MDAHRTIILKYNLATIAEMNYQFAATIVRLEEPDRTQDIAELNVALNDVLTDVLTSSKDDAPVGL